MKRKRDHREDAVSPLALTQFNLAQLNEYNGTGNRVQQHEKTALTSPTRSTSETMSTSNRSGLSALSSPTKGNNLQLSNILTLHCIYLDQQCPKPDDLQELIAIILKPPDGDATPTSKLIANKVRKLPDLLEKDAMDIFGAVLGYQDQNAMSGGEQYIKRAVDRVFKSGCVPNKLEEDKGFRNCMRNVIHKKPKPDYTYGYSLDSFDTAQQHRLRLLSDKYNIAGNASEGPFFPYWIVEWKSTATGGTMYEAITQARRGGAALVHALHEFYVSCSNSTVEPSASRSAVFSMCIDSNDIQVFVHWRRAVDHQVCFEADRIGEYRLRDPDEVFKARSVIFAILAWAKGQRLDDLRALLTTPPRTPESAPDDNTRSITSVSGNVTFPAQQFTPPATEISGSSQLQKRARMGG